MLYAVSNTIGKLSEDRTSFLFHQQLSSGFYACSLSTQLAKCVGVRSKPCLGLVRDGYDTFHDFEGQFTQSIDLIAISHSKLFFAFVIVSFLYLSFDKETLDGCPVVAGRDITIPKEMIEELHQLKARDGLTWEDAVTSVRGSLVPEESLADKLRSLVATCLYWHRIEELQREGVDFTCHMYVPWTWRPLSSDLSAG